MNTLQILSKQLIEAIKAKNNEEISRNAKAIVDAIQNVIKKYGETDSLFAKINYHSQRIGHYSENKGLFGGTATFDYEIGLRTAKEIQEAINTISKKYKIK